MQSKEQWLQIIFYILKSTKDLLNLNPEESEIGVQLFSNLVGMLNDTDSP